MRQTLIFDLHKSKVLNANTYKSLHWAVKGKMTDYLRKAAQTMAEEKTVGGEIKFKTFKLRVTVCPPSRRRLDPPNLYPTVKAIVDGLTDAKWWEDDDFRHMLEISFRYGGLSGDKDGFKLILDIEEVEDVSDFVLESELQSFSKTDSLL